MKKLLTYLGIVLGLLVLSYAIVPQVLGGKIVNQSDISGWRGMAQELNTWNAEHPDDPARWTGSMFSGMPTVTIQAPTKGDWTQKIYNLLLTGKRPATYFFISLLGAFLLMLAFGVHPILAVGGAIAISLCSYNFQIIQVGHNTKMQALAFLPWVLAAVVFCYKSALAKKTPRMILGAALFALALSFQVKANHPQITYYLAIIIGIYVLTVFIWLLCNKDKKSLIGRFFAASALLLALGLIGIGTNATKLMPTWEYTEYSMRGGSSSGESKGLDLGYATAWSYGWEELPNLMIPNFNGGASAGALGPDSETVKLLKRAGQSNLREVSKNLPLYWGPQPFTAGPMYMGAITIFLFVLGLLLYKGKEKWWLLATTLFAIFLAVGYHFMPFTKLAFAVLPLYNKFRTVSMALVILQFTLPLLGFLILDRILKDEVPETEFKRKGWIALAITGGFCLLCALFPSIAGSFVGSTDAGQPEVLVDALAADRASLLRKDAFVSLIFIVAAFLLIWWAYKAKDASSARGRHIITAAGLSALVLINMFAVGHRYLNKDDFVTPRAFNNQFDKRPVDELILQDTDPSYRVLDLTVNVFNDSHPSFWHKNIGGYSPAKLQLYQEYIENHIQGDISALARALSGAKTVQEAEAAMPELESLSKLNCRYVILDGNAAPIRYPYAKGNAWFEADSAKIEMTYYSPNELRYHYASEVGGKAVFSEVYYPAGWVLRDAATGDELEISLSDEVLRSAVLPAGEHNLIMSFEPKSYARGEATSRACSITIILLVLAAAALMLLGSKPSLEE